MARPTERLQCYQAVLHEMMRSVVGDVTKYANLAEPLTFQVPCKAIVRQMCMDLVELWKNSKSLIEIASPCYVIGDIHGHVLDLYRIIATFGMPNSTPYLFLGDLVDRGEFSVQTVLLIFCLILLYPSKVFIIRGNHEFQQLAQEGGFMKQVEEEYDDIVVFDMIMETFAYMPLSCLIDGNILCLHGGIGPSVSSIAQLRKISRPIFGFDNPVVAEVVWSDPSADVDGYVPSMRGTGYMFGAKPLENFMKANGIATVIRAHECVMMGTKWEFERKLVTIFSASNYCGTSENLAAVLEIRGAGDYAEHFFSSLPYLLRTSVTFVPSALLPPTRPHSLQASKSMTNKTRSHANIPTLASFTRTMNPRDGQEPISGRVNALTKDARGKLT
jgi:protein phosphatase